MGENRITTALLVSALAATTLASTHHDSGTEVDACRGTATAETYQLTTPEGDVTGLVAKPETDPTGIVVFMHGYSHTAESWRPHVERVSAESGVIALAINYRGDIISPPATEGGLPSSRGWNVTSGAEDAIAAATDLLGTCATATTVVAYGISMGGNTSGLAIASGATRADGAPLFDYWFNVEGVANLAETYLGAKALGVSGNTFAVNAAEDIELETGGTPADVPDAYAERTVVNRVDDIIASGVRGIVMVHGVDDGLAPHNHTRELQARLAGSGIPVHVTAVVRRDAQSEAGTTGTGYVLGPLGQQSPFAGHASEASTTHLVNRLAFEELAAVLSGTAPTCSDRIVDAGSRISVGRFGC